MQGDSIRLTKEQIGSYSAKYAYDLEDEVKLAANRSMTRGFLTKDDLLKIGRWKSPRSIHHMVKNSEELVQEATALALSTRSIRLAPQILMAIDGVGLPMASAILHWCHKDVFPILDFRALWSLGIEMPSAYSLAFWEDYVTLWRGIRSDLACDKRELDRALWQYAKEHQP